MTSSWLYRADIRPPSARAARVCPAANANGPRFVLLDEATAAIDPTNERAIQSALHTLVADKTLIVVAHRLLTIRVADQILVLENGQLVGRGSHDTLAGANDLYGRLRHHWNAAARWRLGGSPATRDPSA